MNKTTDKLSQDLERRIGIQKDTLTLVEQAQGRIDYFFAIDHALNGFPTKRGVCRAILTADEMPASWDYPKRDATILVLFDAHPDEKNDDWRIPASGILFLNEDDDEIAFKRDGLGDESELETIEWLCTEAHSESNCMYNISYMSEQCSNNCIEAIIYDLKENNTPHIEVLDYFVDNNLYENSKYDLEDLEELKEKTLALTINEQEDVQEM
ncbi:MULTISPECIES: hypothetical protein [unclassified Breznakia]|uniref:hypothetical protein n=1 Tax=unclassified Breznakia TaxID=2623764 RepID=UPI0024748E21|nr:MULTISPECIES: hypothetical protein [unclassified Breznakia]MDH6367071.1 hypothetical protein [Breznakia sp. PH1-1]MDH6404157.1 hypothetical protein [Breznakia sp. PF1-11]MDH6411958.1 hypothetical protein [Breznakia sp. PFB1-11]MDH6414145.1 hypothetical protein [Breznakia sp. PFB1-14]MDH6418898.1 hypothetical protein [Breznakia sp. PFB1-12]